MWTSKSFAVFSTLCYKLPRLQLLLLLSLWLFSTCSIVVNVNAAKILALFAHPSENHFSVMRSIVTELARRGHNITVYSSHRLSEKIERVQEIIIEPEYPFWLNLQKHAETNSLQELSQVSAEHMQKYLGYIGSEALEYFLNKPAVTALLQLTTEEFTYDLVIVDIFYTDALLALGHLHNKPTIGIVNNNFEHYMQHVFENFVPMACTPFSFDAVTSNTIVQTSYWSRLFTIRDCIKRRKNFVKQHLNAQHKLVAKYFAQKYSADAMPTMEALYLHMSMLLFNNHAPLLLPRPLLLNTITAGGLHVRPPKELPWFIKRHLDAARKGAIYMHFGNEQLCADMPANILQILFEVLGKRTEAVVWTCHDVKTLPNLPSNILIQHNVPQTDILAHPHIRVFIMNGDLLSLQEGILRHVLMLGLPLFRHEQENMQIAEQLGVALKLDYSNLNNVTLDTALNMLLKDAEMPLIIRSVEQEYRDRPLGPLETCMYWLDFVLAHNGAPELKTRGIGLSHSSQLHLFDLFIFYFILIFLFALLMLAAYYVVYYYLRRAQIRQLIIKLR